jgi:hypothetical protein
MMAAARIMSLPVGAPAGSGAIRQQHSRNIAVPYPRCLDFFAH